jgi:galactonate dehydratase
MDVIMPDVKVVGGLAELKKIADMAAAWGIPTAPHGPSGPVTIAAGVQTMLTHPEFLILEYGWGEVDWRHELVMPAETIRDGCIGRPEGPGLGVTLNAEVLAAHRIPLP